MSKPKMPQDANNMSIPALGFRDGGAHILAASSVSSRNANPIPSETKVITLRPQVPIFLKFGTSTVVATNSDHFIPAGSEDVAINVDTDSKITHFAVLRAGTTDGAVYASERE